MSLNTILLKITSTSKIIFLFQTLLLMQSMQRLQTANFEKSSKNKSTISYYCEMTSCGASPQFHLLWVPLWKYFCVRTEKDGKRNADFVPLNLFYMQLLLDYCYIKGTKIPHRMWDLRHSALVLSNSTICSLLIFS